MFIIEWHGRKPEICYKLIAPLYENITIDTVERVVKFLNDYNALATADWSVTTTLPSTDALAELAVIFSVPKDRRQPHLYNPYGYAIQERAITELRASSIVDTSKVDEILAVRDGVWIAYSLDFHAYPLFVSDDELEVRRWADDKGYGSYVKFWEFGTEWSSI